MSGLAQNRKRNQTVCFWMSYDERRDLEARIAISGLPKGKYFIQSLLHQQINISIGKYQSDRLSLEIKRLRESIDNLDDCNVELSELLKECKALTQQVVQIVAAQEDVNER